MTKYVCDACKEYLEEGDGTTKELVSIRPCIACNEESYDKGYEEGYQIGYDEMKL